MSLHAYASRDSPPSHTLLDQNLDPRVILRLRFRDAIKNLYFNIQAIVWNESSQLPSPTGPLTLKQNHSNTSQFTLSKRNVIIHYLFWSEFLLMCTISLNLFKLHSRNVIMSSPSVFVPVYVKRSLTKFTQMEKRMLEEMPMKSQPLEIQQNVKVRRNTLSDAKDVVNNCIY